VPHDSSTRSTVRIVALGCRAATVLGAGARARVVAPLTASIYITLQEQLLWLTGPGAALHPRGILLSRPPAAREHTAGDTVWLPRATVPAWRPDPCHLEARSVAAVRDGAARLAAAVRSLGVPAGFGARLVVAALPFPLAGAADRADALAEACRRDDATSAATAARGLLGLGPGLTPSGDDFVGAAFFARLRLAAGGAGDLVAWQAAAADVRAAAARLTHPLSAALLDDLLDGQTWQPLHALTHTLARADDAGACDAARRLVRLGHSSGWDLLAGFLAGAAP
jgi:hypothetical protein